MIEIRKLLKQKKVDITELAGRLNVSRQTVHYYINQADKNSVETLNKIAAALNVPVIDLFERPATGQIVCPKCGTSIKLTAESVSNE